MSPHGGQMVTAGTYHLELVVQEHQTVQVYLYDDALKPVTVPTPEATFYLRLPGNKNHTLTLKAVGGETATSWATTYRCPPRGADVRGGTPRRTRWRAPQHPFHVQG